MIKNALKLQDQFQFYKMLYPQVKNFSVLKSDSHPLTSGTKYNVPLTKQNIRIPRESNWVIK